MFSTLLCVFFLLPFAASAGNAIHDLPHGRYRNLTRTASRVRRNNDSNGYKLVDMYQGQDFLNEWDFFTDSDPTHGIVAFQSKKDAISNNLAFVQDDGTTVLAVDDKTVLKPGAPRKSIRITSKKKYNGGLFIADFWAMPHGCSVWPAWWSVGDEWPNHGEIDILEGVHDQPTNRYTLHTGPGCSTTPPTGKFKVNAKLVSSQCTSSGNDNSGCGFVDTDPRSYGHQFNLIAGGVFAHTWDSEGIKVWHFARGEIPQDITDQKPDPSTWGTPAAFWSSQSCDTATHFRDHNLVIDTTLCGDFAGATYAKAGCPGTCAEAVADPSNFEFAKWKINYIAVYS